MEKIAFSFLLLLSFHVLGTAVDPACRLNTIQIGSLMRFKTKTGDTVIGVRQIIWAQGQSLRVITEAEPFGKDDVVPMADIDLNSLEVLLPPGIMVNMRKLYPFLVAAPNSIFHYKAAGETGTGFFQRIEATASKRASIVLRRGIGEDEIKIPANDFESVDFLL